MAGGIFNKYTGYHNRKTIRLQKYDYSQPGYYFITIIIHNRKQMLLGDIVNGETFLTEPGKITERCWLDIPMHFPNAKTDDYIIMPDHIHGIIRLIDHRGTACRAPMIEMVERFGKPTVGTIPTIVRSLKSAISKQIHYLLPGFKWQNNYYSHIIQDEKSLFYIRQYIRDNPLVWQNDSENHSRNVIGE
jgi:putative transposase